MKIAEQHTPSRPLLHVLTKLVQDRAKPTESSPIKQFITSQNLQLDSIKTSNSKNHQACKKKQHQDDHPVVINQSIATRNQILNSQAQKHQEICSTYMKPYESIYMKLQRLNNCSDGESALNLSEFNHLHNNQVLNGDIIETIN